MNGCRVIIVEMVKRLNLWLQKRRNPDLIGGESLPDFFVQAGVAN
jgi:hypothetical protein